MTLLRRLKCRRRLSIVNDVLWSTSYDPGPGTWAPVLAANDRERTVCVKRIQNARSPDAPDCLACLRCEPSSKSLLRKGYRIPHR